MAAGEEEEEGAEREEEEEGAGASSGLDVHKTLNKMLDKVCGKKKADEDEDVATILRKPIDFTKSGDSMAPSVRAFVFISLSS